MLTILDENALKEKLNYIIYCDFTLASRVENAMLDRTIRFSRSTNMTTLKFDATPTESESINLDGISEDKVKEAWKAYEAKAEYKDFNKHDLIESMQAEQDVSEPK